VCHVRLNFSFKPQVLADSSTQPSSLRLCLSSPIMDMKLQVKGCCRNQVHIIPIEAILRFVSLSGLESIIICIYITVATTPRLVAEFLDFANYNKCDVALYTTVIRPATNVSCCLERVDNP
jgi:hypothetical protein